MQSLLETNCRQTVELLCHDQQCPGKLAVYRSPLIGEELGQEENGSIDEAIGWMTMPTNECK